jgi:PAS domain S-box-containing protein
MTKSPRRTGIEVVGTAPWDSHFCAFYHSKEELLSVVIPYLRAGLEDNEACVWVISDVVTIQEAEMALASHFGDFKERMDKGQIEILKAADWYTPDGVFEAMRVLAAWKDKALMAKERGFDGIRATGDTSWLHDEEWGKFVEYESFIGDQIEGLNMLVLCTYSLDLWEAYQVVDVVSTHEFALIKVANQWRQIENSDRRKAMEDKLAAEEKYRRAVENIHVAVYSALPDEHSTSILLTDKVERITGYSSKELLEDPSLFGRIVHADDRDYVWSKIKEHREMKIPLDIEYRIITKSGEIKWIKDEATLVFDSAGNISRIDGFMEDITQMKQLMNAVGRSEERFKLAQKAANIGSWDWDVTTGKLAWSDEIEPMFGFGVGKFDKTYQAFLNSVHPEDRSHIEESVSACVENDVPYDIEHRVIWPDGSVHWMSEKGGVIRDRFGKAVRMLGVVMDITRQKQIEQEIIDLNNNLQDSTAQLAAANRELEAFAYSVSHDLRAPLRRIDGFSEIILQDYAKDVNKDMMNYLGRIRVSVKDMDRLIEGILRLSRLSRAELSPMKVDLSDLARRVIAKLKAAESDRKVETSVQDGMSVRGDPDLLGVVLDNLIGNSWKFTSKRQDAKIEFGSKMLDGQKVYYVRDNGVGFDKSLTDKLFLPFQRLHSDSDYPGSGIGLTLVSRIVSRHNGRVWADGELDRGATFYFTLGMEK